MYKVCVIGDEASVSAYRAIGFSVFSAENAEGAEEMLKKAAESGEFAVIFVVERLAESLAEVIAAYNDAPLPMIVSIPGKDGSGGYGARMMREATIRAVGSDIG